MLHDHLGTLLTTAVVSENVALILIPFNELGYGRFWFQFRVRQIHSELLDVDIKKVSRMIQQSFVTTEIL